jgi:Mg-chelatase subunit ChlD
MDYTRTGSRLIEKRPATGAERAAAVTVAVMLEKAKYRERDEKEIKSIVPPGRLRTRAIVQGAALKSKGVMATTEPWRRTIRRHTDDPTLTIGVMVDISGSMGEAMNPMATTAWVMSEAAKRIQARTAMVYYGQDVFPTLKPGQHLDQVNVYSAPDGTEKFDRAFKALDGGLNLLAGTGARLLVVVSDGCYTPHEMLKAEHWMKRCQESGVAVLWLPFENSGYARHICRNSDAVILQGTLNPAAAATEIGRRAAEALTKIGTRSMA